MLAIRREKRDDEVEARKVAIEVRRAGRLIAFEVEEALGVAHMAIEDNVWADNILSTKVWREYKANIAPYLTEEAWTNLARAFTSIEMLEDTRAMCQKQNARPDKFTEVVECEFQSITLGAESLRRLVKDQPIDTWKVNGP